MHLNVLFTVSTSSLHGNNQAEYTEYHFSALVQRNKTHQVRYLPKLGDQQGGKTGILMIPATRTAQRLGNGPLFSTSLKNNLLSLKSLISTSNKKRTIRHRVLERIENKKSMFCTFLSINLIPQVMIKFFQRGCKFWLETINVKIVKNFSNDYFWSIFPPA